MKTQNTKQPTRLIAVTSDDKAVIKSCSGEVVKSQCLVDGEGKIYYLDNGSMFYLPQEFQPRLITKN